MPPTLILIRHAQALHNVASDWSFHDPKLSDLGEQQSRELHESLKSFPLANEVELIVVSAMRRTLQTATIGLDWLIQKGVKVLPDAMWQENCDKPCDTGSEISVMSRCHMYEVHVRHTLTSYLHLSQRRSSRTTISPS
jgi:phosphohistidine phosphatase SixA